MRQALLLLLLLPFASYAQPSEKALKKHNEAVAKSKSDGKPLHSLDTIFDAGTPLCLMKREKRGTGEREFTVSSLSGNPLISIVTKNVPDATSPSQFKMWYVFYFYNDSKQAWLESFGFGKHEEDVIAGQKLISGNSVNAVEEARFVSLHPMPAAASPVILVSPVFSGSFSATSSSAFTYQTVQRNENGAVIVNGETITQSGVNIGSVKVSSSTENGKMVKRYSFFLPSGTKIAEATAVGAVPDHLDLTTYRDNISHRVDHHASGDEVQLAKYLAERKYL